jgi:hypothetical protein
LGKEWLSEIEVPEESDEGMGPRLPDGTTPVGGKQGVYVDIGEYHRFSIFGFGMM